MNFRVLAPAAADIQNIENWVAAEFGEAAAEKAAQRLLATFELLSAFQQLGRTRPEIAAPPIRFYALPPNWIVYRPGDPITIIRVLPARMNLGHPLSR